DRDAPDEALALERVHVRAHLACPAAKAAVLGDAGLRQRTAALDRAERETAVELVARRCRRLEKCARNHTLRQLVQALEPLPARDGDLARGEEVLERAFGGLPAPHRPAPSLERARRECSLVADPRDHLLLDGPELGAALAAPPVAVAQLGHPVLEERVVLDREQAGLVGP